MPEDPRFTDDSSQAASEEQRLEKDSVQTADGSKYEESRELSPNQGVTKYGNSEINPLQELVVKQPIPEQTYVPEINKDTEVINLSTVDTSPSSLSSSSVREADDEFEEGIEVGQEAAEQAAVTQGIMGAAQSGIQTAFGSKTKDQALGGALTTGLQAGMATGNPYVGAAAAVTSFIFGSRAAKKAKEKEEKARLEAERKAKLQNMRTALSSASNARQNAMSNLMTVLSR